MENFGSQSHHITYKAIICAQIKGRAHNKEQRLLVTEAHPLIIKCATETPVTP